MALPFDILDHIFSFLKFHPKALFASSKAHPVLSQIVERYRFHHIIIHTGDTDLTYSFNPVALRRYLIETPQISKHVAVLHIELSYPTQMTSSYLDEIASLMPMFPMLECIMLLPRRPCFGLSYNYLPQDFKTAVENCLHLPTLQEVQVGIRAFPLSILNDHANISCLSLCGPSTIETEYMETTYPQIKTLALEEFIYGYGDRFLAWVKRHLVGLQSLKYDLSCHKMILEVFKICSDTLEDLRLYFCHLDLGRDDLIDLSSLPHLRHLTIHVIFRRSYLWRAVKTLKTASMLQELIIEIHVEPSMAYPTVDLSPLRVLTDSSHRFPRLDLYMYTGSPDLPVTHAMMYSWLVKHEGLVELIERGMLVVHPEETAPTLFRSNIARDHT